MDGFRVLARFTRLESPMKKFFKKFAKDECGKRFQHLFQRVQKRPLRLRVVIWLGGVVLFLSGLFLGILPGVPGLELCFLGLGLMATQIRWLAVWLDRMEKKVWSSIQRWRAPARDLRTQVLGRYKTGNPLGDS
jgi:hypothetical protein